MPDRVITRLHIGLEALSGRGRENPVPSALPKENADLATRAMTLAVGTYFR